MKIKNRTQVMVVAALIILVLLFVLFNRNGASIIVGADGLVRREKYIKAENSCSYRNSPAWCPDEFSIAYSANASSDSDTSFYSDETGLCSDGTRDCIYTERYNNNRVLQGIFNNKDEELAKKFLDDVYSGKIQFSDTAIQHFKDDVKFENGTMKIRNRGTWYTAQVGIKSHEQQRRLMEENNIFVMPPSVFISFISVYFKSNNLPKPTVAYELKSEMNMNQYRASLPSPS